MEYWFIISLQIDKSVPNYFQSWKYYMYKTLYTIYCFILLSSVSIFIDNTTYIIALVDAIW